MRSLGPFSNIVAFLTSTPQTLGRLHSLQEEILSSTPRSSQNTSELETAVLKLVECVLLGVQEVIRARKALSSSREQIEEDKGDAAVCSGTLLVHGGGGGRGGWGGGRLVGGGGGKWGVGVWEVVWGVEGGVCVHTIHTAHVGCEDLGLALSLSLTLSLPLCSRRGCPQVKTWLPCSPCMAGELEGREGELASVHVQ